jgi:hypothetical protein
MPLPALALHVTVAPWQVGAVRCNLLILSRFLPDCSQGVVVVVSIAAHPWHCSSMTLGLSRSRSRQPCPWLTSAVVRVVGVVLNHTSGTIVGERLVYIYLCNAINQRESHCLTFRVSGLRPLLLPVLVCQLFFYLGAEKERSEGEQVLLTWELGSWANIWS